MKKLSEAGLANPGAIELSQNVTVIIAGTGKAIVKKCFDDEDLGITSFPDSFANRVVDEDDEPHHYESALFVRPEDLEDRELGTAFDIAQAQYSGCVGDIFRDPIDPSVGILDQLPVDTLSWTNYEIGNQPGARVHNGW